MGGKKVRVIRNKDIPPLESVLCTMQNMRVLEERRRWQEERLTDITQHLSTVPGGGAKSTLADKFSDLADIETDIENKLHEYALRLKRAEDILNGIRNENMRTFVMMCYVENLPQRKIMSELNMTEGMFKRARKAVETAENMACVKWHSRYAVADNNFGEEKKRLDFPPLKC